MIRSVAAAVLVVLAVLVAAVMMPARYVENHVLDTERYLEMVGPLATEPAVQEAVSRALTAEVTDQIDVEAFVEETLADVAERDRVPDAITRLSPVLGPALADQVDSLIARTSDRLVRSSAFTTLWISANEVSHGTAVRVLEQRGGDAVELENGAVTVQLDPLVERAKQALVDRGLTVAERIEPRGRTIVLFESEDLAAAQDGVRWVNTLTPWLPLLLVALVAAAAAVSRSGRRLRTVAVAGAAIAVVMLVLQLVVQVAGDRALESLASTETGIAAVALAVEAFSAPLRAEIWWVFAVASAVALVCFLWPWAARRRSPLSSAAPSGQMEP
ncbi:hypothetical protein LEP48_02170 [Isoptericola sp. NEAU-Y5]|uniref:Integral membrane protein n=1 Tax=Isoptericola luteus TaxID=2879484 RepID=A0ABS7ZAS8_9MICO|nr:hypothetical protein [Isoptericola sp. NEAU-Y5]MCA5892154.1 hypothetical protein [Isoptericola sp. NEAU-Y5]